MRIGVKACAIAAATVGVWLLRSHAPKQAVPPSSSPQPAAVSHVIERTRQRAVESRRVYNLTVVTMLLLVVILVFMFLQTSVLLRPTEGMVSLLSAAVVRIGAVLLGIFASQMLFSFARYHVRLANHLENVADALELAQGNAALSKTFVESFSPHAVDFGKAPVSPIEKVLDVVSEVAKSQRVKV
jgi:uncharacterized integral membrane protein